MKKRFALAAFLSLFSVTPALAKSNPVACWDTHAARGTRPVLKYVYVTSERIAEPKFDQAQYRYLPADMSKLFFGREITTNRSPYKGAIEYRVAEGVRLVLARNISTERNLGGREGVNGVIETTGSVHHEYNGMWGNSYIRLRCRFE